VGPDLIQEITSSGSLVLSTVALLISRLDRHKDNLASTGSISALTDLEAVLDSWVRKSKATNSAVRAYLEGHGDLGTVRMHTGAQYAYFGPDPADDLPLVEQWQAHGRRRRRKRSQNFTQFLRIHVPEFSQAFESAARKRYALLNQPEFNSPPTDELAEALEASSKMLEKALVQLQTFMRKNVPP
jgi:hypothetical protein